MLLVIRLISNNINKVKLYPNSLLSNRIINVVFLHKYDYQLYNIIKKNRYLNELKFYNLDDY